MPNLAAKTLFLAALHAAAWATVPVPPTDNTSAAAYLARLASRNPGLAGFRGRATLTVYGEGEGNYAVTFGRAFPDKSRLEIEGPLGGTALVVTTSAGDAMCHDVGARAVILGPDTREFAAAVIGVDLGGSISGIIDWFSGKPPVAVPGEPSAAPSLAADSARDISIYWRRPGEETPLQQLILADGPLRPVAVRRFENGRMADELAYDDWREEGGYSFPFALTVKTTDVTVEIKISKIESDIKLDDALFGTTPPSGAAVSVWPPTGSDAER